LRLSFQGGDIAYRQAGATAPLTPQSVVFIKIQSKITTNRGVSGAESPPLSTINRLLPA
jgi:hypothetical protein